jgi:hypothetical protein
MAWMADCAGVLTISAALIRETEPVIAPAFFPPYPMRTTSVSSLSQCMESLNSESIGDAEVSGGTCAKAADVSKEKLIKSKVFFIGS